jgi:hypothetical protein
MTAGNESVLLSTCDETLPISGVTREFDFGQFIELFDSSPDPNNPKAPPSVARVVIETTATLAAERDVAAKPVQSTSSPIEAGPEAAVGNEPQVHLLSLTEHGPAAKVEPADVTVKDRTAFFESGQVEIAGKTLKVDVDTEMREALSTGLTVTAFAKPADSHDNTGKVLVKLSPSFEDVYLDDEQVFDVVAGGSITTSAGSLRPALDAGAVDGLLQGNTVLTHGASSDDVDAVTLRINLNARSSELMQTSFEIFDLPQFLAHPQLLASDGGLIDVSLPAATVTELARRGRGQLQWGGTGVDLTVVDAARATELAEFQNVVKQFNTLSGSSKWPTVKPPGVTWDDVMKLAGKLQYQPYFVNPHKHVSGFQGPTLKEAEAGSGGTSGKSPSMTDMVQPRLPSGSGLPVAVFVPWRQSWSLTGFSRGSLLHSIALAPQEQVTLQVFSWERRIRSLEQSSESEVEQETETTQTSRDTDDVFREMVAKHDFAWQLSGSLDASYSNGVASIQVGMDGQVSDTQSIEQTARTSSQRVRESTIKATGRVRSKRVTRITQSVESGHEERVTRVINNPNQCHTLTLDFFEALAHYEIKLEFMSDRLRLVVLVPNPIHVAEFSSEVIRRNETTLRNSLLEPALIDGFDACRMVAAYDEAKALVLKQQTVSAKAADITTQRDQPPPSSVPDPAAPQQAEVTRIVKAMVTALKQIHASADIDPAMVAIRGHKPVSEDVRRHGQYWLFINFAAAKFPAVLSTLDQLSTNAGSELEDAQKVLSVLPKPDAPTNLGNLNQMSDGEKETAGIASKIKAGYMKSSWDWAWWSGRMREEGLYTANDAGLGGLADQLARAYQDWEAKKAQGAAMKNQDVAKTEAEGKQDQASADDKLAMAFPLEELAHAYERQKVLRDHLEEHSEFYNFALFQSLPPSEQVLRIIEVSNGRLQVGVFEPRAVAMNGSRLAVPLTPLAGSAALQSFIANLKSQLTNAFQNPDGSMPSDTAILPTPGVTVSSRLGKCSGCEEFIEKSREYELKRLAALAEQEQWEATRRQKRIEDGKNYDDFEPEQPAIKLELGSKTPSSP